jgi:hypothetical protein
MEESVSFFRVVWEGQNQNTSIDIESGCLNVSMIWNRERQNQNTSVGIQGGLFL